MEVTLMRISLMVGLLQRAACALAVAATLLMVSCPVTVGAASVSASYGIAPAAVSEAESCCIDCTQGYRYMQLGRYADALHCFRDGEKVYTCTHDTMHALFVSHFLHPQFECLRQLRRYEEATVVASRIMLIRDSLSSRSSRKHRAAINHAETTDTLAHVTLDTPWYSVSLSPASFVTILSTALLVALVLAYLVGYYVLKVHRAYRAQVAVMNRLNRIRHIVYGSTEGADIRLPADAPSIRTWASRPGISADERLLATIMQTIVEKKMYLNPNLTRADVISEVYVPKNKFAQLFKTYVGTSFRTYINNLRIDEAVSLFKTHPEYTVEAIVRECGMASAQTFYRVFSDTLGMSPSEYRTHLQRRCDEDEKEEPGD